MSDGTGSVDMEPLGVGKTKRVRFSVLNEFVDLFREYISARTVSTCSLYQVKTLTHEDAERIKACI